MPEGATGPPDGTRDFRARTRDPGGGLKVFEGGLGVRSMGGRALRVVEDGGIPEVTWPMRGPTTREVSTTRSRDGLEVSGTRAESTVVTVVITA